MTRATTPSAASTPPPGSPAVLDTDPSPDADLERRLADISRPENQGEGLRSRDLMILATVTLLVPLVALVLAWNL